ncbi:magnesium transporter NIPA-domain-containing protein [Pilobolus umbonatus]|nr:magnesium transporter NIPA-domain-containing protein [Pilobolus umbonatus]
MKELWSPLLIALIASMTQAFGISIQRKSHLTQNTIALYKRPLWIFGFLIYTVSTLIGSTCTIGYLPIIILAPVGAIGLVFNAIFAKWILGDPFTSRTVVGTGLIVLGAGLVAGFGVVAEPNHTLDDLITLYKRPSFIIYFAIIELFTVLGLLITHVTEYLMASRPTYWIHPDLKTWLGISYGVFGANISSQAMLFAKSGLELLLLTLFHHDNQFIYPLTWFIVLALVVTSILQLYYLNRGVQLCDTIILVPLNFCSFNISCLFNGLVYYNQWHRLVWWQVMNVLIGIILLIYGVLVISLQPSNQDAKSCDPSPSFTEINPLDYVKSKCWNPLQLFNNKKDIEHFSIPNENTSLLSSI